jgi:hypothetical protein
MRLTAFGSYTFPNTGPEGSGRVDVLDVGNAPSQIIPLPDGTSYDALGLATAKPGPRMHSARFTVFSTNGTASGLDTALDAVRALVGRRDKLVMTLGDGTTTRFCYARCVSVNHTREARNWAYQPVELLFEAVHEGWYGACKCGPRFYERDMAWDTGGAWGIEAPMVALADGATSADTWTNAGNRTIYTPIVRVAAGTASITHVAVQLAGYTWYYDGEIWPGTALEVRCGPKSVVLTSGAWRASQLVSVGRAIVATGLDGIARVYEATTSTGSTGMTEPAWPANGTVSDGDVVWTYRQLAYTFTKFHLATRAAATEWFAGSNGHQSTDWLALLPGDNTVQIKVTGGGTGANYSVGYYDGYW